MQLAEPVPHHPKTRLWYIGSLRWHAALDNQPRRKVHHSRIRRQVAQREVGIWSVVSHQDPGGTAGLSSSANDLRRAPIRKMSYGTRLIGFRIDATRIGVRRFIVALLQSARSASNRCLVPMSGAQVTRVAKVPHARPTVRLQQGYGGKISPLGSPHHT
jgi:hypothetical protein